MLVFEADTEFPTVFYAKTNLMEETFDTDT